MKSRDNVAVIGSVLGLVSIAFGWLTLKPNRIAAGTALYPWQSFGWAGTAILLACWLVCLLLAFRGKEKKAALFLGFVANTILILAFFFTGLAADQLLSSQSPIARVALSAGFWLTVASALIIIFAARQNLSGSRLWGNLISWTGMVAAIITVASGQWNGVSTVQEFLGYRERFGQEFLRHVSLFGVSVLLGTIIGIPLGLWAARNRRAEKPVFFIANITQTIPSLVLFGLLIAPLSALSFAFPALRQLGIRGIGPTPAIIALTIYSLLPIVRNTYVGLHQIDAAVIDAGRGMGLSRSLILRKLELPLAAPLILEGVRTASVQAVGNTAVAALIGAGGLGWFVFEGLGQAATDLIIMGTIPIIVLALVVDAAMHAVVQLATPKGI